MRLQVPMRSFLLNILTPPLQEMLEMLTCDVLAGTTIGLTLIPQVREEFAIRTSHVLIKEE